MTKTPKVRRGPKPKAPIKRFRNLINKEGPTMPEMSTNCEEWDGCYDKSGYPVFGEFPNSKGGIVKAHHYAYEKRVRRRLKKGTQVYHKCGNRKCVRGDHLTTDALQKK